MMDEAEILYKQFRITSIRNINHTAVFRLKKIYEVSSDIKKGERIRKFREEHRYRTICIYSRYRIYVDIST